MKIRNVIPVFHGCFGRYPVKGVDGHLENVGILHYFILYFQRMNIF
jgi:hypothetical protein